MGKSPFPTHYALCVRNEDGEWIRVSRYAYPSRKHPHRGLLNSLILDHGVNAALRGTSVRCDDSVPEDAILHVIAKARR